MGGGMDRPAGSRPPDRWCARAAPAEHEGRRDGPAVHRAGARRRRHSGAAGRGGRGRRSRLGSGGRAGGSPLVSRHPGAAVTTTTDRRMVLSTWLLPFGVTLLAMFALQLSNLGFSPLLPSIQQEFGMSYTQLGLFTGLYGLLAMLLSVPAGVSARRFGEKRVLGVGLLGVAAGSVL